MLFSGTKVSDLSKASIIIILAGFITLGASFYFFFELADEVLEKEKFAVDQWAVDVMSSISSPRMDQLGGWITEAGSVTLITVMSVLLLIYLLFLSPFSRWVGIYFAVNMIGISALTKGLKLLFERQRPEVLDEYDGTGFSFPSGHSTGSMVFYGFLIYLIVISPLRKGWKWLINSILGILILCVGLSRVYLGVHYFTDILAGFLFGLAWLMICIAALEVTLWNQRRRRASKKSAARTTEQA
ncbi:undecaprenyl-diphosphatase [Halobacillus alkaliphilus]|uniref:Undecaprenyl-diphosphatase n=1 Tax=Halobacillus alkaliphilus TaxID=396056 RepID=A0A1I2ND71_9BACI|nr:phosphatase PAP2 family protein [Halobacillus alkaliphilus]SFF99291.1 undecaprenyl-diphosphatase [Halobacillus alkaliphilus]